jgi:hypothetical protein
MTSPGAVRWRSLIVPVAADDEDDDDDSRHEVPVATWNSSPVNMGAQMIRPIL